MQYSRFLAAVAASGLLVGGCSSGPENDAHAVGETASVELAEGLTVNVTVDGISSGDRADLAERGADPGTSSDDNLYWFVDYTIEVAEGDMELLREHINEFGAWSDDWTATNNRGGEMAPVTIIGGTFDCGRGDGPEGLSVDIPYVSCKVFAAPSSVDLEYVEVPETGTWRTEE
ncbi:hypothetical protein VR010_03875 [Actinomycetaceae bacterium L2_0104]